MLGMGAQIYKLWRCEVGDVSVMVKEELCGNVLEVRRVSDGMLIFEEGVLRLIWCMLCKVAGV